MTTSRISPILRQVLALLAAVILPGIPTAQGQATKATAPDYPAAPVYYYNGAHRVSMNLLLDEVRIEAAQAVTTGSLMQTLRAAEPSVGTLRAVDGEAGAYDLALAQSAKSPADLTAKAKGIARAAGVRRVSAILVRTNKRDRNERNRETLTGKFTLRWKDGENPDALAREFGFRMVGRPGRAERLATAEPVSDDVLASLDVANRLQESGRVEFASPLLKRWREPRAAPNDTEYGIQWHLKNTGSNAVGAVAGNDVNIEDAWSTVTGAGVNIAVTDDGVQVTHPDLSANARTDIDIDINNSDLDPSPSGTSNHGTAVAGVAAARGNNALGVAGAGYQAGIVGIRLIAAATTDQEESSGMLHQLTPANPADRVDINTNSWGPTDDGTYEAPGPLTALALADGVTSGRGGLGTIYTWAAGNGLGSADNANYDGYANSPYTIAIAATGAAGQQSYYSEPGACILVNTPSNYWTTGTGITTTDRTGGQGYGAGDYTNTFGGTSSAAPLGAGCVALVLDANPGLNWRDMQHLLVQTATKNSPSDASWFTNGAGRNFSHKFGFGRINATAAVAAALNWTTVTASAPPLTASEAVATSIPDNNTSGISRSVVVSGAPDYVTEHVQVTVTVSHTYVGDLRFELVSPSGTVSVLAETRGSESASWTSNSWTFMTVANWGENPNGTWTLKVSDRAAVDTGTLHSWSVKVLGYAPSLVPVTLSRMTLD